MHARPKTSWKRIAVCGTALLGSAVVAGAIGTAELKKELRVDSVDLPTLTDSKIGVQFYDINDHYLCTMRADRDREPVALSSISPNMRNALLAAEDHHFYSHHGIDYIGTARAFKKNREAGRIVEGGSTITQQLVRNLYLDKADRSYARKLKEVFLAWDIESKYSKPKILETYLNEIYFGGGVYGIERAASHYFSKHASHLTVPEAAFLAGLIKSPSIYGNPNNRALAVRRQQQVLEKMVEYGYISSTDLADLKAEKLFFKEGAKPVEYPYYLAYTLDQVRKEMGPQMWTQSLKVYTNLDPAAQKIAAEKLNKGIKSAPRGVDQGALVSMRVSDGAVVAMVGGVGRFEENQWNRALFPHTAGSCFKPFVYLSGLMNGVLEPDTMINDETLTLKDDRGVEWSPKNFDGQFKGWVTVRDALINSRNVCAVKVALSTGIQSVIDTARAAGLTSKMDAFPSLALGTCAVSPLEMATAYGTLARDGVYMPPQVVRRIVPADGKDIRVIKATPSSNLPGGAVATLVDSMQDVVNRGTGTQARLPGIPVAGKTGTADGARDIWFCGFTPDTVTAVWGGSDKNQKVRGHNVTGGTVMAHIWHDYMSSYIAIHKPTHSLAFVKPATKFIGPMPELSDETLLTTDASSVDVSDLEKIPAVDPLTTSSNQMANNVPVILSNALEAKQKGIGKAFLVLAAEAADRFQNGGGAAARSYTNVAFDRTKNDVAGSVSNPNASERPRMIAQAASTATPRAIAQGYAAQPGLPPVDAVQQAYAQQAYALQAQFQKREAQSHPFEQPANAANTY